MSSDGKTCSTCRHWLPPTERDGYQTPVKFDYSPNAGGWDEAAYQAAVARMDEADKQLGACRGIPMRPTVAELPNPACAVIDGSDYYAEVFTAAEFFCAIWAADDTAGGGTQG